MVLGFILYETIDLATNTLKLTYKGGRAIYYWWYGLEYPEVERQIRSIEDIEELNKRLERLEQLLEDKKTTQ